MTVGVRVGRPSDSWSPGPRSSSKVSMACRTGATARIAFAPLSGVAAWAAAPVIVIVLRTARARGADVEPGRFADEETVDRQVARRHPACEVCRPDWTVSSSGSDGERQRSVGGFDGESRQQRSERPLRVTGPRPRTTSPSRS